MSNKKGIVIPVLGTAIIIMAILGLAVLGLFTFPFESANLQRGGRAISLSNHADFWIKSFDESLEIISKRAAYDLGKTGGIEGTEITKWSSRSPTLDTLKEQLENKIKENLPQGTLEGEEKIEMNDASINVSGYDTLCGPVSNCFFVDGNKNFSVYDKLIDSTISVNHKFELNVSSNYFKLLQAGIKIVSDPAYIAAWPSEAAIRNLLIRDFVSMDISIDSSTNKVSLWENCLTNCIAPTKAGETRIRDYAGNEIPYDYVRLNFSIERECSDGIDNDGDGLIDEADPGCHTDLNVTNSSSFDPNGFEFSCQSSCDVLLSYIYIHYGAICGQSNYNAVADVDKDKRIDLFDFVAVDANCNDKPWCDNALNNNAMPC